MTGYHRLVVGLTALLAVGEVSAQAPVTPVANDTMPAAVVQRFVDAANARDVKAMGALVAPTAYFERFPTGQVIARGREAIEALYARSLPGQPPSFRITVDARIVEGNLVVDQELIAGGPNGERKATWMYQVQGGLIQRAWVLDGRPSTAP